MTRPPRTAVRVLLLLHLLIAFWLNHILDDFEHQLFVDCVEDIVVDIFDCAVREVSLRQRICQFVHRMADIEWLNIERNEYVTCLWFQLRCYFVVAPDSRC